MQTTPVQGGLSNVIRHYKSKNYALANQSLDRTSSDAIRNAVREKAVRKDLKAIGVVPEPGCCFPKPYTAHTVKVQLGVLIDQYLPPESSQQDAGQPVQPVSIGHPVDDFQQLQHIQALHSPDPLPSAPATRADALRGQLEINKRHHDGVIQDRRDDAVEQFEEIGVYNQLNEQSIAHQIAQQEERIKESQIKLDQRAIQQEVMDSQLERLAQLREQQAELDKQAASLPTMKERKLQAELEKKEAAERERKAAERARKAELRKEIADLKAQCGD